MRFSTIIKFVVTGVILAVLAATGWYINQGVFAYPSDSPSGKYTVELKTGDTIYTLAQKLKNDKVINNADILPLVAKFTVSPTLKSGAYLIDLPAKPDAILWQINNQKPQPSDNTVSVSFIEGDTAEDIADKLEKANVIKAVDFLSFIQDPKNFDLSTYPFLPKPQTGCKYGEILKSCPKYYLEGYLFPDTYNFFTGSKPEAVTTKLLRNFNTKFWVKNSSKFDPDLEKARAGLFNHVILSSVVEREVGRNYIKALVNATDLNQERREVSRVYLNREIQKMRWQSDPTVWYGVDRKKGVALDGDLNWGSAKYKTGYNTYQKLGFPVGPIANSGAETLESVLNPAQSDYLFFVSDKSGKMYFGKNLNEHNANVEKVRQINKNLP